MADNLDPHWNWIETTGLSGVTRYHKTTCRHLEVVPVESDGQIVAHLCQTCDAQLPAEWQATAPKPGAKADELALWQALEQGEKPRDAGVRLGIPPNRVEYLCLKWGRQGIYDWGVVHDLGWINR